MVLLGSTTWGGVAEWLKATVLKTVNVQAFVGSNPTPSVFLARSCEARLSSSTFPPPLAFFS